METEITEFTDIEPEELHFVARGANGFPPLLAKAEDDSEKVDCPTCKGKGKIMGGNRDCPDCDDGKVSQAKADELGKAAGDYESLVKAKYNADDLKAMADKGQAMPNPDGDPSYPIADKDDLDKAIKAVGRGNADHDDIRKHIIKRAKALKLDSMIPDNWEADGSLAAAKAAGGMVPDDDGVPGSKTWEAADADRLQAATQSLLDLQSLLQAAAERERIEGQTVDPSDMSQAWTLEDACYMLQNLLGCVAAMAVMEQRESDAAPDDMGATKAGKVLSAKNVTGVKAAIQALQDLLTSAGETDNDGEDAAEKAQGDILAMTKEELIQILDDRDTAKAAAETAAKAAADEAATKAAEDAEADRVAKLTPEQIEAETAAKAAEAQGSVNPDAAVEAVAELKKAVVGVAETLTAAVDGVAETLTKMQSEQADMRTELDGVKKMAAPGGPVKTRTPDAITKSEQRDSLMIDRDRIARMLTSDSVITDSDLSKGYEEKLRVLNEKLAAL